MSAAARRTMTLVGFLQASNSSNLPGSWRHAETASDFLSADYFQRIARTLEAGRFHLAFFDDRLAMPDRYQDDHRTAVLHGIRTVKLDLVPLLTAMGLATRHLGLGGTYSTTYYEPFHVARVFATLDHMLGGRVAWNVVTSLNDSEAANFGQAAHLGHDERYDRADEFMEAVLGHWDSWDDDALVIDKARGVFAHPEKVRRLDFQGRWYRTRGPLTVPRSPQGRPLVIQAGQSGRGRRFAARWGELVFVLYHDVEEGRRLYREFKAEVAAAGRDPDRVRVAPAVYCVVGETRAEAEDKMAYIERLAHPLDRLTLLSEVLNFDFGQRGLDEPFTTADLEGMTGLQAIRDRVVTVSGKARPTPRDFVEHTARGTVREHPCFVGTAADVADGLEEWLTAPACDGFVVAATHMPGAYEDFTRYVSPELQRRGLLPREYPGTTLRQNLGLPHPRPGERI